MAVSQMGGDGCCLFRGATGVEDTLAGVFIPCDLYVVVIACDFECLPNVQDPHTYSDLVGRAGEAGIRSRTFDLRAPSQACRHPAELVYHPGKANYPHPP